jgi:adenine-specific DNA-methyltransferase
MGDAFRSMDTRTPIGQEFIAYSRRGELVPDELTIRYFKKQVDARADLHMFKPDIDILSAPDGQVKVKVNGVDVFHPNTGEVRSDGADGIACWFIDTDYNEESFFVRHAYFLGANDPYKSLKTTLKAEINHEAWESLNSDTSRAFDKPKSGRIAVKVINHLGDEVMKVFRI